MVSKTAALAQGINPSVQALLDATHDLMTDRRLYVDFRREVGRGVAVVLIATAESDEEDAAARALLKRARLGVLG